MSHTVTRADRLEAIRVRALRRHARRQKAWCAEADKPVNPWAGRHTKRQTERIRAAERLSEQARIGYARIARTAWLEANP